MPCLPRDVRVYMVVPMIIAMSSSARSVSADRRVSSNRSKSRRPGGGPARDRDQQARLLERVQRQAEELEQRVERERSS